MSNVLIYQPTSPSWSFLLTLFVSFSCHQPLCTIQIVWELWDCIQNWCSNEMQEMLTKLLRPWTGLWSLLLQRQLKPINDKNNNIRNYIKWKWKEMMILWELSPHRYSNIEIKIKADNEPVKYATNSII